jgi:hypothetical protein
MFERGGKNSKKRAIVAVARNHLRVLTDPANFGIFGNPETTHQLSDIVAATFFANLIVLTGCLAFVLRKSMQTGKEPVKVSLRLAFARP